MFDLFPAASFVLGWYALLPCLLACLSVPFTTLRAKGPEAKKMASEKQMAYITKLNTWKQAGLDLGKVKLMGDDEASSLIDELKARKSVRQEEFGTPRVNHARMTPRRVTGQVDDQWKIQLGMAKKDVHACFSRYGRSTTDDRFKKAVVEQWKCYNDIDRMVVEHINNGA